MYPSVTQTKQFKKKNRPSKRNIKKLEINSVNEARRRAGLPELISKERGCIVCARDFMSLDPSHRVCENCRPKWERKRRDMEKSFVTIEDTETFNLQDLEDLNIFEDILVD